MTSCRIWSISDIDVKDDIVPSCRTRPQLQLGDLQHILSSMNIPTPEREQERCVCVHVCVCVCVCNHFLNLNAVAHSIVELCMTEILLGGRG